MVSVASTSAIWRPTVKAKDGTALFHALQYIDPEQVDEAFFAVDLSKEPHAAANCGAVFGVIGRLFVGHHVPQGGVRGKVQPPDFGIDFPDGAELAGTVHVRFDIDGSQTFRELARFTDTVIFFRYVCGTSQMVNKSRELEIVKNLACPPIRRGCARFHPISTSG